LTATDGARPLRVGVVLPVFEHGLDGATARWADLKALARRAEELGLDSVWLSDHLVVRPDAGEPVGMWESWSVAAALGASTARVQVGTLVSCVAFRNPALLAKMADTLDEISGGRLVLGLGAGWHDHEFRAFGYPFDHLASRFEEALSIICPLLRDGRVDFAGTYHQARGCELRPRGPRPSGPPVLVAARGHRMLRLAARFADLWNEELIFARSHPDQVPALRDRVDAACRAVGRDPATLGRTLQIAVRTEADAPRAGGAPVPFPGDAVPLAGPPETLARAFRAFAGEGIAHLQVRLRPFSVRALDALAPVLELLDWR
jgi:alkanesulfonate monooxygenase SsuD/methylene tetrahydromethanopterin reductase-like flavin-dependent oxidoreductase (luciferase family)